ncbi:MAG: hypothetical protein WCO03_02780 [bacterium]
MYGQIGIVAAYGLLLLVCSFLLRFLDGKNNQDILKAGLFSGLALMFSAHFVFFLVPVYLVFIIGLVAKRGEYKWKPLIGYLLLSLVLLLAINANWLASYVRGDSANSQYVAQGISQQDLKAFQTVGKNGLEAYKNVIMMSGFWGKEQRRYIDLSKVEEGWGRSFFILLPIIIYGVYLGLKRDNLRVLTLSLVSVYLVALVLAVGIASPTTGPISEWLFAHLPFYKGLREPQKWVSVLIMVYLIFLSIGIDALFKKKLLLDNKKVAGLFLVGVMIMQAPFMLWGLKGQVRPVEYPSDWAKADKFIKAQSFKTYGAECGKNILFLPWHLYMSFEWIGNVVANPAPVYFTCPVISGTNMETRNIYDNSPDQRGRAIGEWVLASGDGGEKILDEYEIGYIVLAKEVDWGKYTWLEKLPNWKLVVDSKTLRVYERR